MALGIKNVDHQSVIHVAGDSDLDVQVGKDFEVRN